MKSIELSGPPCLTPEVVSKVALASSYVKDVLPYHKVASMSVSLLHVSIGNRSLAESNNHARGMWSNSALKSTNSNNSSCFFLLDSLDSVYSSVVPRFFRKVFCSFSNLFSKWKTLLINFINCQQDFVNNCKHSLSLVFHVCFFDKYLNIEAFHENSFYEESK